MDAKGCDLSLWLTGQRTQTMTNRYRSPVLTGGKWACRGAPSGKKWGQLMVNHVGWVVGGF